jgi:hypothetical protein
MSRHWFPPRRSGAPAGDDRAARFARAKLVEARAKRMRDRRGAQTDLAVGYVMLAFLPLLWGGAAGLTAAIALDQMSAGWAALVVPLAILGDVALVFGMAALGSRFFTRRRDQISRLVARIAARCGARPGPRRPNP